MTNNNLIACIVEGTAERVIIENLLRNNKLIFSKEDLLDQELLRCRSSKQFEERYLGKDFTSLITVYRILDSKTEKFKLRKIYESKVEVINVITAPEIEILVIIKENKYSDFNKYKSQMKPSEYCKQILRMSRVKSKKFLENYFSDPNELEQIIRKYKSLKDLKKEKCLADILK